MYDTIIIGAGPAGLTAATYSCRRGLKTLVLSKDIGGQITKTSEVENYPGFEKITGAQLAQNFFAQAKKFGAEILFEEATRISREKDSFVVTTSRNTFESKSIILAFGKSPKELGVPGESKLKGRGVSYCATCDAPFFRDKTVTIAGGGNSALSAALVAAAFAKQVYVVHRRNEFRADEILVNQAKEKANIEFILSSEIVSINGNNVVESITLNDDREIQTDGIIIEVGFVIDRTLVKDLVELDENNQVIVDSLQATSIPGIFAAGDLTQTPFKQVVVSAGEGAKAALSCYDYLQKLAGKKGIYADWH